MKEIEERAKKYGIESANLLCSDVWTEEQRQKQAKVYARVYSKIATEQKAIDIEKACECFELAEDWQAWANGDFKYAKEYFRKVLEEETATNR